MRQETSSLATSFLSSWCLSWLQPHHSSDVPLVLNLQTRSISPQYHVGVDDAFSTVASISVDTDPLIFRMPLILMPSLCASLLILLPLMLLFYLMMPPHELLDKKRRRVARQDRIRDSYIPPFPACSAGSSFIWRNIWRNRCLQRSLVRRCKCVWRSLSRRSRVYHSSHPIVLLVNGPSLVPTLDSFSFPSIHLGLS